MRRKDKLKTLLRKVSAAIFDHLTVDVDAEIRALEPITFQRPCYTSASTTKLHHVGPVITILVRKEVQPEPAAHFEEVDMVIENTILDSDANAKMIRWQVTQLGKRERQYA
jgi:hypothetical protein